MVALRDIPACAGYGGVYARVGTQHITWLCGRRPQSCALPRGPCAGQCASAGKRQADMMLGETGLQPHAGTFMDAEPCLIGLAGRE